MGRRGLAQGELKAGDVSSASVLQAVIETSDDAIFTHDVSRRITSWSTTAERLFGYQAGDILGEPSDRLFPMHLRDEVRSVFATVAAGDRVKHFETEIVRKDGMPMPIWLSLCPVFDTRDEPVASIVMARDITEQRLAQATLAEITARVDESEALAHVGSWLWDVRTGAVQWSDESHRIHGVDPLDFDGTFESHIGMVHPDDQEGVRTGMQQSVAAGEPFESEYRVVRPDQEVRTVHARAHPTIGSAGTAVGLRGIVQDITGRA